MILKLNVVLVCISFFSIINLTAQNNRAQDSLTLVDFYQNTSGEDWNYTENKYLIGFDSFPIPNAGSIWDFSKPISTCLLYTSPSPRDRTRSRMPSSA